MAREWVSAAFYPTTVIFVDDDPEYLQNISYGLNKKIALYKFYDFPHDALEFLNEKYLSSPFTNRCLIRPEDIDTDHRIIDVDVRRIHREIYNSLRFKQVSVVIVDYAMPGIKGLELCKQIKDDDIKTILLTGVADEQIAINAFNDGIIDNYIRKDDVDFDNHLNNAIAILQNTYFHELSALVINALTKDYKRTPSCLNDPVFVRYFANLREELNITEYYLMEESGCFLMLDFAGKPSWLSVKTEEQVYSMHEFAEMEKAPEEVRVALNNRTAMPHFHTDDELQTHPSNWQKYMHPIKQLSGNDIYFCAVITNHDAYDIGADKMVSFADYLRKQGIKF